MNLTKEDYTDRLVSTNNAHPLPNTDMDAIHATADPL